MNKDEARAREVLARICEHQGNKAGAFTLRQVGAAGTSAPGSHPTDQAPAGLGAARVDPSRESSAIISPCGTYRYRLDRPDVFGDYSTAVIMVNPSTADATKNDATIRKLIGFRNIYGWGHLIVGNLFAYRATDVRELATAADPIGPDNMYRLAEIFLDAQQVIFAWGPSSKLPKRLRDQWRAIDDLARKMHCAPMSIGAPAKDGQPCHPLLLPYERKLQPWPAQGTPTRSAETTDSVGEADGGPVGGADAPEPPSSTITGQGEG